VTSFADEGISGANGIDTRRGLYDAIAAIDDGTAGGIVFTSLDRLARRMTDQEGILARVWAPGGRAFSIGDGGEVLEDDPDDPMRTAVRQMRGVFAQLERGLIRQRMAKGRREKLAAGGYIGGAPAFGLSAEGKALVEDATEQACITRITQLSDDGKSLREIVAILNLEDLKPRRGQWHPTTVSRVLRRARSST